MIQIYEIESPQCFNCTTVEHQMIKVGAIIFCKKCKKKLFGDIHVIELGTKEHELYKELIEKYKNS